MDVISYLIGKKSGGGSSSYNAKIDGTKNYNGSNSFIQIVTEIGDIDTSKFTNLTNFFKNCQNLKTAPNIDLSKIISLDNLFTNCYVLENVPIYDVSKALTMSSMFSNCYALSDTSLDNILQMCIGATRYGGTKTLYAIGLRKTYYTNEKIQSLPHYNDFITAGWTTGLD